MGECVQYLCVPACMYLGQVAMQAMQNVGKAGPWREGRGRDKLAVLGIMPRDGMRPGLRHLSGNQDSIKARVSFDLPHS